MPTFRHLHTPFSIKNLTLKNRIVMPPMCQYQATDGMPNDWHYVHYVSRAIGGVGLVIVEMTNVAPNGRISPRCLGLWNDEQADAFKRIVDGVHAQGAKIGIQIAHAGRKAQDCPDAIAPSAIHYGKLDFDGQNLVTPKAMSTQEIDDTIAAFVASARRAVAVGFDVIELHGAHGYLIHQFSSPKSNLRDDEYGKDKFLFGEKVIQAVKAVMPADMPLIIRISAQEYGENGYDSDYGVQMAQRFAKAGVDMIHVSGGGDGVLAQGHHPAFGAGYQVGLADKIKKATDLPVIAVGMLDDAQVADFVLESGEADLVAIGRGLLRDPHWWLNAQQSLGLKAQEMQDLPPSYARGY